MNNDCCDEINIVFCDKYNPLFDLLDARNVTQNEDFQYFNDENKEYWTKLSRVDTVIVTGGRDSGKTFALSLFAPIAANNYNHRILYTRYSMTTTDQSIISAVKNRIKMIENEDEFYILKQSIFPKEGKGKIIFTGIQTASGNQSAKLKSLEDFSIFVLDEAEEMPTFAEWDKIRKSMRVKDVQCLSILIMNPTTSEHWIYEELFEGKGVEGGSNCIKDNVLYIHTSYLDMKKEWIAEHNMREYETLRKLYDKWKSTPLKMRDILPKRLIKKAKYYLNVILGGWLEKAEGVIYEDWEFGEFDKKLPSCYIIDYGFYPDPLAFIKVAVNKQKKIIYLHEIAYLTKLSDSLLIELIENNCTKRDLILVDHNEPRTTSKIKKNGFNVKKAIKGIITEEIRELSGYKIIVTRTSRNAKKELNNYKWNDKKSSIPIDLYNHIMDGMRYGTTYLLRGSRKLKRKN